MVNALYKFTSYYFCSYYHLLLVVCGLRKGKSYYFTFWYKQYYLHVYRLLWKENKMKHQLIAEYIFLAKYYIFRKKVTSRHGRTPHTNAESLAHDNNRRLYLHKFWTILWHYKIFVSREKCATISEHIIDVLKKFGNEKGTWLALQLFCWSKWSCTDCSS